MVNNAEERVSRTYNEVGWETEGEITEDAKRFEDLRECAKEYVSKCRLRVLKHIPDKGKNILDMGSGPIQYKEYLEYSKNYEKRHCVDFSSKALDAAERKIGDHGVFLCGNFLEINLEDDFFDCAISLHTLYHIDKNKQEGAVRKLIAVTKPDGPVIIVYSNPRVPIKYLASPLRLFKKIRRLLRGTKKDKGKEFDLYFFAHPIKWWDRFRDVANIQILPWRSLRSDDQKVLMPNNTFGKKMFDMLFNMEEQFPDFFVKHFQYPMIILQKKSFYEMKGRGE